MEKRQSLLMYKKGKRKVQGVPQSQTAALPRPQEEEETDKSKQAQTSCTPTFSSRGHCTSRRVSKYVICTLSSRNDWEQWM